MITKEVEKFNTETGGDNKKETSVEVERDPIVSLVDYGQYFDAFKKDFRKIQKEVIEIKNLKEEAASVRREFNSLEERTNIVNNFVTWVAGGVVLIFFTTGILIALDYFKYNQERYEKFIDKSIEINQDIYNKGEVDLMLKSFKDCIWYNGLVNCLK